MNGDKKMTYGEIYEEFRSKCECDVMDYRPCCELYDAPNITCAIVVWLKNGSKIIFIHEENIHNLKRR